MPDCLLHIETYCLIERLPFALFISKILFIYEFINFFNDSFQIEASSRKARCSLAFRRCAKKAEIRINKYFFLTDKIIK